MRRVSVIVVFAALALVGCAGQPPQETIDKNLAVSDFIELRELESLSKIRSDNRDGWQQITPRYLIYRTRRADYLFEFVRPCRELSDNTRILADERFEADVIRARFDTLRGCRIAAIYALDEDAVAELENIGDPPGSRN